MQLARTCVLWTRRLQVDRRTYSPARGTMTFNILQQQLTNFSSDHYQVLTELIYLLDPRRMEGWAGLSTTSVGNLLKVITQQQSCLDSNSQPESLVWDLITMPARGRKSNKTSNFILQMTQSSTDQATAFQWWSHVKNKFIGTTWW